MALSPLLPYDIQEPIDIQFGPLPPMATLPAELAAIRAKIAVYDAALEVLGMVLRACR